MQEIVSSALFYVATMVWESNHNSTKPNKGFKPENGTKVHTQYAQFLNKTHSRTQITSNFGMNQQIVYNIHYFIRYQPCTLMKNNGI